MKSENGLFAAIIMVACMMPLICDLQAIRAEGEVA